MPVILSQITRNFPTKVRSTENPCNKLVLLCIFVTLSLSVLKKVKKPLVIDFFSINKY